MSGSVLRFLHRSFSWSPTHLAYSVGPHVQVLFFFFLYSFVQALREELSSASDALNVLVD